MRQSRFYLSTILDDFSRYIIAWKVCTTMKVADVTDTLNLALTASGCDKVKVEHRPRLLSDNGPCYVASDLGEWLEKYKIDQVHGAPGHSQTQGKIERWHQTLKNHGRSDGGLGTDNRHSKADTSAAGGSHARQTDGRAGCDGMGS